MDVGKLLSVLLQGGQTTLTATVLVGLIALPLSFLVGLVRSFARARLIRLVFAFYVEIFRGTSAIVQLFWAYFVLPSIGVEFSPFAAGVLVLGLNAGAYGSEIVRGALQAVPEGQREAAAAVNFSRFDEIRFVLLPQAIPITIPPLENLAIEWFKATSLLSLISVADLTYRVNVMAINRQLGFVPSYLVLMAGYLLLSVPLSAGARKIDGAYGRNWRAASEQRSLSRLDTPVAL